MAPPLWDWGLDDSDGDRLGDLAKRDLADLRARFRLSTEELIYLGRANGWLIVPGLESA